MAAIGKVLTIIRATQKFTKTGTKEIGNKRKKNEKLSGPIKNSHKTHGYKKYEDMQNYR